MNRVLTHCLATLLVMALGLFITPSWAAPNDISAVQQQLLVEIKQANKSHEKTLANISKERAKLLQQLAAEENKQQGLSQQVAAITRNKDEQTLTLENLEKRLSQWQQQLNFIHHLFDGLDGQTQIRTAEQLTQWLQQQAAASSITSVKAALPNGDYVAGKRISLGPLNWFVSDDKSQAGFIQYDTSQWLVVYQLEPQQTEQLAQLVESGSGVLPIDPSNNRNITLAQHQESLLDHIDKGGIWVFPILAFAVIAFVIATVKAVTLLRLPKLQPLLNMQQACGKYQQQLIDIAKQYQGIERDDKMLDALMSNKRKIEKGLSAIAVTASVAPLLGLLGTVSGMIQTFKLMTLFGSGDANAVSGGISESLVTTELGLIVAIPALVAHALMSRKCQHYMSELESFAVHLSHAELTGEKAEVSRAA